MTTAAQPPLDADLVQALLGRLGAHITGSRRARLRAAAHLLLPDNCGTNQLHVTRNTLTWRDGTVERGDDDLRDLCRLVRGQWSDDDQPVTGRNSSDWLKPLPRGRRWLLAGTRELLAGPIVFVHLPPDAGNQAALLRSIAGEVTALITNGADAPAVTERFLIEGDQRQWQVHLLDPKTPDLTLELPQP